MDEFVMEPRIMTWEPHPCFGHGMRTFDPFHSKTEAAKAYPYMRDYKEQCKSGKRSDDDENRSSESEKRSGLRTIDGYDLTAWAEKESRMRYARRKEKGSKSARRETATCGALQQAD